eukprot:1516096-Prorocentrum_lima.AAC.1
MPDLVQPTQQRNRAQSPRAPHWSLLRQHWHLRSMPHRRAGGHTSPKLGTELSHRSHPTREPPELAEKC